MALGEHLPTTATGLSGPAQQFAGQMLSQSQGQSQGPSGNRHLADAPAGACGYQATPGVWDEMITSSGEIRPAWSALIAQIEQTGATSWNAHQLTVQRLLRENGVTYNVYQDSGAAVRPWEMDVMPLLLTSAEFAPLEQGLQQRLRLFRAILHDIYGPQHLIREGLIPPRLLFANPAFLRGAMGTFHPEGHLLYLGTNVVRLADGSWRVLSDRTQMPSGLGYALENRIIGAQVLSQEMKRCRVQRLAGFFERERNSLRDMAPLNRGTPHVVMLTAGPKDRNYFEHAFKARYLGFPLVEGADLTVRDRRLFLKTLEGLRQVDVLIRHMQDWHCDSLELDAHAPSGIPGLMEAWRSGKVRVVNSMGSGVMEAAAWLPFLPQLCQRLLGEGLHLPALTTWWCGQEKVRREVLSEPRHWVFKRAFGGGKQDTIAADGLDEAQLKRLLQQVEQAPEQWVAQEMQRLSTTPSWVGDQLQPRSLVLRLFGFANQEQCHVMPGGLGRVSREPGGFLVSLRAGAVSKDVWVLAETEVEPKTLLPTSEEFVRVARPAGDVPSRIADHLFWLGRYAERLEQTTRVLRMLCQRLTGEDSEERLRELHLGLRLAKEIKLLPPTLTASASQADAAREIRALIDQPQHEGSVADLLARLRYNAAAARDRLSDDTWRLFNRLIEESKPLPRHCPAAEILAKLDRIVLDMAAFSGMQLENMVQGHGWRFLEIGRRLERSMASVSLNQAAAALAADDDAILLPLLEIFDSTMTYRRYHVARPKLLPVLDLLWLNPTNPRSLLYQLNAMLRQSVLLPSNEDNPSTTTAKRDPRAMLDQIETLDLKALASGNNHSRAIEQFCESLTLQLESFSHRITEDYFSHTIRKAR